LHDSDILRCVQTATFDYHSAFQSLGLDNSFSIGSFTENLSVSIQSKSAEQIVFDVVGIDAPIANALRRILISEIPTMAIETVNIYNNTSILQDEVRQSGRSKPRPLPPKIVLVPSPYRSWWRQLFECGRPSEGPGAPTRTGPDHHRPPAVRARRGV
jgi:hypothetical protein